jgi:hypothetical protein
MNNSIIKKIMLILSIVLFIFSLVSCKTLKAAVSFKWGKRTESEHYLEAKNTQKKYLLISYTDPWMISKK